MAITTSEILVFIAGRQAFCSECKSALGTLAWITLADDRGAVCLACADLYHLVFLPSGDVALTRRARRYSRLSAVVLKWSRSRKRYERQGLLVEEPALERAESECLEDTDTRARRRARAAERRAELDLEFVDRFAESVRSLFPGCPTGRERQIAEHACLKYSGRVGRSAAGKALDEDAIGLAVQAHIRHTETPYDELLSRGTDRHEARAAIQQLVDGILHKWRQEP